MIKLGYGEHIDLAFRREPAALQLTKEVDSFMIAELSCYRLVKVLVATRRSREQDF